MTNAAGCFADRMEMRMKDIKICFFRHGETLSNITGICAGRSDELITEDGHAKLVDLRESYVYPQVQKIFSSPAVRCRQTADAIYPGCKPEIIFNLWEVDFGVMDGLPAEKVLQDIGRENYMNKSWPTAFPGGETYLEASFRARAAVTQIAQRCMEEEIDYAAVFTHGDLMNMLMKPCLITDEPPEAFLLCPNGMGYEVSLNVDEWFEKNVFHFVRFLPEGAPRPKPEESPYYQV